MIPTTRGSNYAIHKSLFLNLYQKGLICVDMQVGPVAKLAGARIAYSGDRRLRVLTSGRRFRGGWSKMPVYFFNRFLYNLKAIPPSWRQATHLRWEGFDKENADRETFSQSD